MPVPRTTQDSEDTRTRAEITSALSLARRKLRQQTAVRAIYLSLFVPALAAAVWVAVSRFTLLELPAWPILVGPALWLLALGVWTLGTRPTLAECARYLDSTLHLDERLTTLIELDARSKYTGSQNTHITQILAADTVHELNRRSYLLPSPFRARFSRWQSAASAASVIVLLTAMIVPTSMDAVKAERRALRSTLDSQIAGIENLRADLVARPGLPDTVKQSLDEQLTALEAQLQSTNLERSDAVAAIAAAEEQVRDMMPDVSSAEFEPLLRAAGLIIGGTAQSTDWDAADAKATDDLGKAAEALSYAGNFTSQFTAAQGRTMANSLELGSQLAGQQDSALAQHLTAGADALRTRDQDTARTELDTAAQGFLAAQAEQQSADAVESALSKLSDGRQSVAKSGTPSTKRQQVGFKRVQQPSQAGNGRGSSAQQSAPGTPGQAGQDASTTPGAGAGQSSAGTLGQILGQNQPAYGANPSSGGSGPGAQQPGSSSGQPSGSGQNGSGRSGAGTGAGGGSGGGSGNNGPGNQSGSVSGQITGPVRVGGATGSGGDAAGNGVGTSSTGQTAGQGSEPDPSSENVYVPGADTSARTGIGGQAAPEPDNGISGRVGEGQASTQKAADPGLGQLNTIRTPYTRVLGEYAQEATQALDRQYVPPDAKQYVRDYFTALGK